MLLQSLLLCEHVGFVWPVVDLIFALLFALFGSLDVNADVGGVGVALRLRDIELDRISLRFDPSLLLDPVLLELLIKLAQVVARLLLRDALDRADHFLHDELHVVPNEEGEVLGVEVHEDLHVDRTDGSVVVLVVNHESELAFRLHVFRQKVLNRLHVFFEGARRLELEVCHDFCSEPRAELRLQVVHDLIPLHFDFLWLYLGFGWVVLDDFAVDAL